MLRQQISFSKFYIQIQIKTWGKIEISSFPPQITNVLSPPNLEGQCEAPHAVPRSRLAIQFKCPCAQCLCRLRHFEQKSPDSKPYIFVHISPMWPTPPHCGRYDVEAICKLPMRSRAYYGSDILNTDAKFPNPIVVLTYSYNPPKQFEH